MIEDKLAQLTEKKQKLDKLKPLPRELVKNFEEWFKVELTYSSNAIEGNTLSRIETAEVIERGVSAVISGKALKDQLEAVNHAEALEFIKALAKERKSHQFITEKDIKAIHKIILKGINDQGAGKYRQTEVFIKGADVEFPSAHKVPYLMMEFIQWLEDQQGKHAVRVASEAHFKLVSIHPFVDGNGRTARLLMNLILMIGSYPMAIIRNEERISYLEAVNLGQTQDNLQPLYSLVEKSVERSLNVYLKMAQGKKPSLSLLTKGLETNGLKGAKLLKIGELAKETGELITTIRYWTKEGLLTVKDYTKGGYQLYEPSMIERVKEIRQLQKEKRLTLNEIKEGLKR
ncbi:Fic family protein [Patescibacteria group bacterium]|nr:Fic family protein [Patescibacteria group bacterium]